MRREPAIGSCRRGFTLIELLVVIAIIALLVAILLPSLGRAKMLAKMAVCLTNTRTLVMAEVMYSQDFKDRLPGTDYNDSTFNWNLYANGMMQPTQAQLPLTWLGKLRIYEKIPYDATSYFKCPIQTYTWNYKSYYRCDYMMNAYAEGRMKDTCQVPSKAMLVSHANMARISGMNMEYVYATWSMSNNGLEQVLAGSGPFGFADGHCARIKVGPTNPENAKWYPDIFFAGGNEFGSNWPKIIW